MKDTVPKSPAEYLRRTEHAVRHMYAGLDSCWSHYQQALEHWDLSQVGQPMTPEYRERLNKYLDLAGRYFDLKLSEAMFAGAILQIAYMAIRIFSRNVRIPPSASGFVRDSQKSAVPFCIGREIHGIPLGLLIYAARNQYSHWDEDIPHEVTRNVFGALGAAFEDNMFFDLGFEIANPTINVYANEVLLVAMRWTTYDDYEREMESLLALPTVAA